MARLAERQAGSRNALAFPDMFALAEGTSTAPATAMNGYVLADRVEVRQPEKGLAVWPVL